MMKAVLGRAVRAVAGHPARGGHSSAVVARLGAQLGVSTADDWYQYNSSAVLKACRGDKQVAAAFRKQGRRRKHIWEVLREGGTERWIPWLFKGGVPRGFWDEPANHRWYAEWLGERLGLRQPADWYAVTQETMTSRSGAGLLNNHYAGSPQLFVQSVVGRHLHPEHEWLPWLFHGSVPNCFWSEQSNRAWYASWLGSQLGLCSPDDWYALTARQIKKNSGGGLLKNQYGNSPYRFVQECVGPSLHPKAVWLPWRFAHGVGRDFWGDRANHAKFVAWLRKELSYETADDWYQLTHAMVRSRGGAGLLYDHYNNSPSQFVEKAVGPNLYPNHDWLPWEFANTPRGCWEEPDNHGRYARWLSRRLGGLEGEEQWRAVKERDFHSNGGKRLLDEHYDGRVSKFVEKVVLHL